MKNRIASLFALDTLLGQTSNGHDTTSHPPERRRKRKRAGHTGKATKAARGRSVDKGDPIRCEHDVAYKPVAQVDVAQPAPTASVARQLGDEYDVEAFEEPDEDLTLRLEDVDSAVDRDEEFETASSADWEEEPQDGSVPVETSEPVTAEAQSFQKPPTFAAEMSAVEQDLAELAARAAQPAQAAPTNDASTSADSADAPTGEPPRAAPPKPSGHAVFDQMAQGMGYATEFRLPPVQLSQVFSALDRQLDADAVKPGVGAPAVSAPSPADPVTAIPPTETLIKDLVAMPASPPTTESAPVSPG